MSKLPVKEVARRARIRKVLASVVKLLNQDNRELWAILTALRGPDWDSKKKEVTTCQVRRIIGMAPGACGTLFHVGKTRMADEETYKFGHFGSHYRRAIEALKLLEYDLN